MKIVRVIGIALLILIALATLVVAALFTLFDENKIKGELTRGVFESTQRKLTIDGDLKLSVWPDVALRVGRVILSEPRSEAQFAALDSARVAVAVLPLLSKRVEVRRVEIDGLMLNLVRNKDGSLNIKDLAGGEEGKDKADAAKEGAGTPLQIDVAGIALHNARLSWRDDTLGKTTMLSDLDFSSGRLQGDVAEKRFRVEKLSLATTGSSGSDKFELALNAPLLSLDGEQVEGKAVDLSARLSGNGRVVDARLGLGGVAGSAKSLKVEEFTFNLNAKSGDSVVKAQLASPVAVDAAAQVVALEKIAGSVELSSPALPMKQLSLPLSGKLRADLDKQRVSLDLGTAFDESKIALKLGVSKFASPAIDFALDIDRLDLDRYLPPAASSAAEKSAAGAGGADAKIDLSALKGLKLAGDLKIGQLQVHRVKMAKLAAHVAARGGKLDVAPLTANLYGGSLNGSLAANASGNQFAVRQNLSGVNIQPLLKDLLGKDPLEGHGSLSLDVTTRGETVTGLKKGLAGRAAMSLKDGAVKGINVAKSLRDLKGALGARQTTTVAADGAEKTDFSEFSATFNIAGGVAHNDDLSMKSPLLRLSGSGDIDIGNDRIDYLARISVVNTTTGQEGKDLAKLKGITVPLRLRGPFSRISYSLELGSVIEDVVKEKVKEEVKKQLGEQLKGLFGR